MELGRKILDRIERVHLFVWLAELAGLSTLLSAGLASVIALWAWLLSMPGPVIATIFIGVVAFVSAASWYILAVSNYIYDRFGASISIVIKLRRKNGESSLLFGVKNRGGKNLEDVIVKLNHCKFSDLMGIKLDEFSSPAIATFQKIEPGATELIEFCTFQNVENKDNSVEIKQDYNIEIEARARDEMTVFSTFIFSRSETPVVIKKNPKLLSRRVS